MAPRQENPTDGFSLRTRRHRKSARPTHHRLRFELLESRQLLSISPTAMATLVDAAAKQPPIEPVASAFVSESFQGKAATDSDLTLLAMNSPASQADGDRDSQFGTDGLVRGPALTSTPLLSVVSQPDGKTLVCGVVANGCNWYTPFLTRFNADGTIDTSFGNGGTVSLAALGLYLRKASVAVGADGKIVVLGQNSENVAADQSAVLLRLNADGSTDTSFGLNGHVVTGGLVGSTPTLMVQSDGKVLAVGNRQDGSLAIVRYDVNGNLDATFANGGTLVLSGDSAITAQCTQLQYDGKILIGGGTSAGAAMIRLNAGGTLDTTFGVAGTVSLSSWNGYTIGGRFSNIAVRSNGQIIATAGEQLPTNCHDVLIRLNNDGTLDASFGQNGGTRVQSLEYAYADENNLLVQSDGKIVILADSALTRYNADGTIDTSFGDGGTVSFQHRSDVSSWLIGETLARTADGDIIVAGFTSTTDQPYGPKQDCDVILMRFVTSDVGPLYPVQNPTETPQEPLASLDLLTLSNSIVASGNHPLSSTLELSELAPTTDVPSIARHSDPNADGQASPASNLLAGSQLSATLVDAALSDRHVPGDSIDADQLVSADGQLAQDLSGLQAVLLPR
ncbi:MAG: hypothetical protein LLG00_16215 [Planctomycetaceae bacterium]|nr:hypothetical protein [Planctomycetaceae bacterium]